MTVYYVNSVGGSNTSPYDTWAKGAATLLTATALAASTDTIYIASDHNESQVGAMTLTLPTTQGLRIISSDRTSGAPPTTLTAGASVACGAGNVALSMSGCAYIYGVSFLGATNANASCDLVIGSQTTLSSFVFENCTLHCRGNHSGAVLGLGSSANSGVLENYIGLINTAIGVGNAGSSVFVGSSRVEGIGVTLLGTAPTSLFAPRPAMGCSVQINGSDLTGVAWTNLVAGVAGATGNVFTFAQCKMVASYIPLLTTAVVKGNVEVFVFDSDSGDVHGLIQYANAMGSMVSDTGVYFTGGAAAQAWKITTTANASFGFPFITPWIDFYNSTLSAQAPYIEILRNNDSTSAYNDDNVWIEVLAKTAGGSPVSELTTDRRGVLATAAAQDNGAGLGSWTGETGSCWSGKLAVASLTPAENGHIRARVCVGLASIAGKLLIDPQVRV